MKLLYIGDAKPDNRFVEILRKNSIEMASKYKPLGRFTGRRHFYRHFHYFLLAVYGFFKRKNYDAVFIWQQYIGIYYYFLSLLWPWNKKPVILFYVTYIHLHNPLLNKLKNLVFLKALNSDIFDQLIFLDKDDCLFEQVGQEEKNIVDYYAPASRFIEDHVYKVPVKRDFFSGGASNRRYEDLAALARMNPELSITIAGKESDRAALTDAPKNLDFVSGKYGRDFEQLMLESRAVIIPLADPDLVSGLLVILSALQAGKVVIITKNSFLLDSLKGYGENEFIYQYEGIGQLQEIIDFLDDDKLAAGGVRARQIYTKHLQPENMYQELAEITLKTLLSPQTLEKS
jgi:hypothetical protein